MYSLTKKKIYQDRTKYILPKLFFTYDLQQNDNIDVQQIYLSDSLTDLFTKSLPTLTFKKLVYKIGMHWLRDIMWCYHKGE